MTNRQVFGLRPAGHGVSGFKRAPPVDRLRQQCALDRATAAAAVAVQRGAAPLAPSPTGARRAVVAARFGQQACPLLLVLDKRLCSSSEQRQLERVERNEEAGPSPEQLFDEEFGRGGPSPNRTRVLKIAMDAQLQELDTAAGWSAVEAHRRRREDSTAHKRERERETNKAHFGGTTMQAESKLFIRWTNSRGVRIMLPRPIGTRRSWYTRQLRAISKGWDKRLSLLLTRPLHEDACNLGQLDETYVLVRHIAPLTSRTSLRQRCGKPRRPRHTDGDADELDVRARRRPTHVRANGGLDQNSQRKKRTTVQKSTVRRTRCATKAPAPTTAAAMPTSNRFGAFRRPVYVRIDGKRRNLTAL